MSVVHVPTSVWYSTYPHSRFNGTDKTYHGTREYKILIRGRTSFLVWWLSHLRAFCLMACSPHGLRWQGKSFLSPERAFWLAGIVKARQAIHEKQATNCITWLLLQCSGRRTYLYMHAVPADSVYYRNCDNHCQNTIEESRLCSVVVLVTTSLL